MEKQSFEERINKYVDERGYYDEFSVRKKLKEQITGKMRTMMIGCIAQMEKFFGEEWGHGLLDDECTDEQLDKKAIWRKCREVILDFGNAKLREVDKELAKYKIQNKGY